MMSDKSVLRIVTLCLVLGLCMLWCAEAAHAGDKATGADKGIASKEGVSESLGNKEFDKDQLPGPKKIGFAFGSVIAMIAVIKFL